MVDIKVAIKEFKDKMIKVGNADKVHLRLICNCFPKNGREEVFWIHFNSDYDSLELVDVDSGGIIEECEEDMNCASLEREIDVYGDWYGYLAGYDDDYDTFKEVPMKEAIKALECIAFDSYDIVDWSI